MSHSVRNRPHRARNQAVSPEMGEDAPGAVAARAAAAAGRALDEGRVAEAERLGRLAANMKKLAPAAPTPALETDDDDDADLAAGGAYGPQYEQCSASRCSLRIVQDRTIARFVEMADWLHGDAVADVKAWAAMAAGIGMRIEDDDLRQAVAVLTADCLEDIDSNGVRAFCREAAG